jgi:hypothetical protein
LRNLMNVIIFSKGRKLCCFCYFVASSHAISSLL